MHWFCEVRLLIIEDVGMNDQEPANLDPLDDKKVICRKEDRKETESRGCSGTSRREQEKIIILTRLTRKVPA
jgi:hypothetical protein